MKAPWFKFWAEEMLRETRWLTPEQRGYFLALMCEAWLSEPKGSLPVNRDMIWKLAGADSKEKFEAASGPVLEMFEQAGERYWYRKLADQDREIRQVSQSRSDAGKNGAKRRWQGDGRHIANAITPHDKQMASVIPSDGKSIADLDVDPDSDRDTEEMRDVDESVREEFAPVGASATDVAARPWVDDERPLTAKEREQLIYEPGDEDIPW